MAFSDLEKALLAYVGVTSSTTRKLATAAVKSIARATVSAAPAVARGGLSLAAYNPVLTGGALGLGALQTGQGQELLMMAEERGRMDRIRAEQLLTDLTEGAKKKARKPKSSYNKAVGASMKAIRESKFMGKKGYIANPKATFKKVAQTVSKINRGKKVPASGASGVIKRTSVPILDSRTARRKAQLRERVRRSL